jgi:hypothetical protein
MKPVEFVEWMQTVKNDMGGVLKNIKAVMKIDGLGARFGKDGNGRPFFEGSRTGPIFDSGSFSRYATSKDAPVEVVARAKHYDNMLEIFRKGGFMKSLPNNTKIVAEIFYNPMATEDETGITFVTVKYDKKKLGDLMTIMPYNVIDATTGVPHPDEVAILKSLYKQSNSKIKIIDPNLRFTTIDVSAIASAASVFSQDSLKLMTSRKKADKETKMNLLKIIQKLKDDLSDYLIKHPGIEDKWKLGDEIEGVVLHLPTTSDGTKPFKITTPEFQKAHAAQRSNR